MLRVLYSLVAVAGVIAVAGVLACNKSTEEGGFGEAKNEQPGVHVKPADKPAEDVLPDFKGALKITPAFDKASGEVTVTLAIAEGFHAYAQGEQTGVPVNMTVDNKNGWVVDGEVKVPAGKEKDLGPDLGKSVILEGTVPVSAKVKDGQGDVTGAVQVQICTNKSCDRPRKHTFTAPTS